MSEMSYSHDEREFLAYLSKLSKILSEAEKYEEEVGEYHMRPLRMIAETVDNYYENCQLRFKLEKLLTTPN